MKKNISRTNGDLDAYFRSTKAPGPLAVEPGQEVGYTRYFCKQMNLSATDPTWRQRGKVTRRHETNPNWVYVRWNGETEDQLVGTHVLAKPGPNLRWCE